MWPFHTTTKKIQFVGIKIIFKTVINCCMYFGRRKVTESRAGRGDLDGINKSEAKSHERRKGWGEDGQMSIFLRLKLFMNGPSTLVMLIALSVYMVKI